MFFSKNNDRRTVKLIVYETSYNGKLLLILIKIIFNYNSYFKLYIGDNLYSY